MRVANQNTGTWFVLLNTPRLSCPAAARPPLYIVDLPCSPVLPSNACVFQSLPRRYGDDAVGLVLSQNSRHSEESPPPAAALLFALSYQPPFFVTLSIRSHSTCPQIPHVFRATPRSLSATTIGRTTRLPRNHHGQKQFATELSLDCYESVDRPATVLEADSRA